MDHKVAGLLGMARRAGRLALGFDAVKATIAARKARLILLASDISPKTEKELRFVSQKVESSVPFVKLDGDKETCARLLGNPRPVAAMALEDQGFADALLKRLKELGNTATCADSSMGECSQDEEE